MILDGKKIKGIILEELKDEVLKLSNQPKLVVIQVGNDEASNVYIKQKINMCNYIGYECEHIKLDNVNNEDVILLIDRLNKDESVTGIMVQLPLSDNLDTDLILNRIDSCKDVDGLTDDNIANLFSNRDCLSSCTPSGVMELLDRYNISVNGKNVVIVGRSNLVGKPLSLMMLGKDASVTICHSKTNNLSEYTRMADILVVAVGKPNLITGDMVKEDSVIIDVGINRLENGLCGDVDFDSVKDRVKYITPVPGGVGPMTVAMLGKNILKSYKLQNRNK